VVTARALIFFVLLVGDAVVASLRSLHYEPIFRLLLKVAVIGALKSEYRIFERL
jgi:hypothetical protein